MSFWPREVIIQDVITSSLWALIAGFLGSILILTITFFASNYIDIQNAFADSLQWIAKTKAMFPIVLSIITFVWTMWTVLLTYNFLSFTDWEKYKKNSVILWQISFFSVMAYMFFTPLYIYGGLAAYENIMYIFICHVLVIVFWMSIILEVMNNYRYILIWIYGSFIGLFMSAILSVLVFTTFSWGTAKLMSLVLLLPLINFSLTFFKQLFELMYYQYYVMSGQDKLGDIFYQIKLEEEEVLKEEEEKNLL